MRFRMCKRCCDACVAKGFGQAAAAIGREVIARKVSR